MSRSHRSASSAGDLLIVGAGVTGMLIALSAAQGGWTCTVIDNEGVAARQSGHSHGYVHRGYAYLDAPKSFIESLSRSRLQWDSIIESTGVAPICREGHIGFHSPYVADRAARNWRRRGLAVRRAASVPRFRTNVTTWFLTDEPAYDFTSVLAELRRGLPASIRIVKAQAMHCETSRTGAVTALRTHVSGVGPWSFRAQAYVLAAGTGNSDISDQSFGFKGRGITRRSFMLVVDSPGLPLSSAILPGPESAGLFIVPRLRDDGRVVWLVSDFVSTGAQRAVGAEALGWFLGVTRTLQHTTDVLEDPSSRLGGYVAPKAELRTDPRRLDAHAFETLGHSNLVVASPTKLSLAPLLAAEVVQYLEQGVLRAPASTWERLLPGEVEPPMGLEHWMTTRLLPQEEFMHALRSGLGLQESNAGEPGRKGQVES